VVATFVLALVGVVISSISLAWQIYNFVLSGPRIAVELGFRPIGDGTFFNVKVRNRGRGPSTVVAVGVVCGKPSRLSRSNLVVAEEDKMVRLEAGHLHEWKIKNWTDVWFFKERLPRGALQVRGFAELATGKRVLSSQRSQIHVDGLPPSIRG